MIAGGTAASHHRVAADRLCDQRSLQLIFDQPRSLSCGVLSDDYHVISFPIVRYVESALKKRANVDPTHPLRPKRTLTGGFPVERTWLNPQRSREDRSHVRVKLAGKLA